MLEPCERMLSTLEARAFQKVYCMPSGPGAELGILLRRALISDREKRPSGESDAEGGGLLQYSSWTSWRRVCWDADLAVDGGSGVCSLK